MWPGQNVEETRAHPPIADVATTPREHLYLAGAVVDAGIYEEVSRGTLITLDSAGELPNLNRPQPSRFVRLRPEARGLRRLADWLCGWMWGSLREEEDGVIFIAGDVAPPGVYRELERGTLVELAVSPAGEPHTSNVVLPNFQSPHPSLYRRLGPLRDD